MKHQAFISYAHEDQKAAFAVVARLRDFGIDSWIDRNTVAKRHGAEWLEEIAVGIEESQAVVVIFSRHANASDYVLKEVHHAVDHGKPLIPFIIENVKPERRLGFLLRGSQWLNAFPLYEKHLDELATSVWRLTNNCNATAPRSSQRPPEDVKDVTTTRWLSAHLHYFRCVGERLLGLAGRRRGSATTSTQVSSLVDMARSRLGLQRSGDEAAYTENPHVLAASNRWWRIKEIIESLEAGQLPLGPWSQAKQLLGKRLAEFGKAYSAADEALVKGGATAARPKLEALRAIIADHPDIGSLEARMNVIRSDRGRVQAQIETLRREDRWTAIENAIRTFARENTQASQAVLDGAARASAGALRETRRFDLFLWTIGGGIAIAIACGCMEGWLGGENEAFASSVGPAVRSAITRSIGVLVRFGTIGAVLGFLLAAFGVRQQGSFAGVTLVLMAIAAAAQALPLATAEWGNLAASLVFAITVVVAVQFATCRLIGSRPRLLDASAFLAAIIVGCSDALPGNIAVASAIGDAWNRWLPHSFLFGGLLAASGALVRRRDWWIPVVFAAGLGVIGPASSFARSQNGGMTLLPAVVCLLVAGWMSCRPTTLRGYVAILAIAAAGSFAAETMRLLDAARAVPTHAKLAPLLSLWAIACGLTAIREKGVLSTTLRLKDILAKQWLRMQCAGSKLAGRQLAETRWFREGSEWHAKQGTSGSSAPKNTMPKIRTT